MILFTTRNNIHHSKPVILLAACSIIGLTACSDSGVSIDSQLQTVIANVGITGDPTTGRTLPSINDPKAQLGMKVFFTKNLGAAGDNTARQDSGCVTCHHPALGGGDNLSLPIGVQAEMPDLLGPGRFHDAAVVAASSGGIFDGGPTVPRNAPTTYNIALWDRALFHDGRVEALTPGAGENGDTGGIRTPDTAMNVVDINAGANLAEAQSRFPVTSPEEMKGFEVPGVTNDDVRNAIAATMTADWATDFNTAFGDNGGVTYARIAEVMGEYERSQIFIDTPWKAYVDGDKNGISDSAKRGALLFFRSYAEGGANCASCHSGDFFTDEEYHAWAMPQVGRGKGDDSGTGVGDDDFGRFRETGAAADMYAFRTPTLLNVSETGPWNHAGSYTTLEALVRHKANPATAISNYDFSQLNPTIQASNMMTNTQAALDNGLDADIQTVNLSDEDVDDIVAFLTTSTDPCVTDRECIGQWIPDAGDSNPDGLRINAVDSGGNFL